ncbi:MAG: hypothetical protein RMK57_03435 [Bryobacterales bacterium]|nr:hypothetical protein [Bryobacteraceae bacterium]MDW8353561.1 hypothetical protein [Bryobacterales bacterium]
MPLRFTLFNAVTLLIMAVTLVTGMALARRRRTPNWPFLSYLLILAYWRAFEGALHGVGVSAAVGGGLLLRLGWLRGRLQEPVRWITLAAFGYILLRGADLILGGELSYLLFRR